MKWIYILPVLIMVAGACKTQKATIKVEKLESQVETDSVEYELETFDGKFESWYAIYENPAMSRSLEFYENWNRQYVMAWNYNATSMDKSSFFEPIVGYDPNVEYGFDINHELFYYFQYVENVLKIEIMPGSPKVVPF